jgi:hypothetical protein
MSRRADQAERLARLLSERFGIAVRIVWHAQRPRAESRWRVSWTDGPGEVLMASQVRVWQGHHPDLDLGTLWFDRGLSSMAWACSLLDVVPTVGDDAAELLGWAARFLEDYDWPGRHLEPGEQLAAAELHRRGDGDPQKMAALLAADYAAAGGVTKLCNGTTHCHQCGRLIVFARTGPRPRHCSAECRLRGWRMAKREAAPPAAPAMCEVCRRDIPRRGRGRPPRYCSQPCRQAAYRRRARSQAADQQS